MIPEKLEIWLLINRLSIKPANTRSPYYFMAILFTVPEKYDVCLIVVSASCQCIYLYKDGIFKANEYFFKSGDFYANTILEVYGPIEGMAILY
jgi:hypothetical protein